jgi:hypothetical protein
VLFGFATHTTEFVFIKPDVLLNRLNEIHGETDAKFQIYLWVTQEDRCF